MKIKEFHQIRLKRLPSLRVNRYNSNRRLRKWKVRQRNSPNRITNSKFTFQLQWIRLIISTKMSMLLLINIKSLKKDAKNWPSKSKLFKKNTALQLKVSRAKSKSRRQSQKKKPRKLLRWRKKLKRNSKKLSNKFNKWINWKLLSYLLKTSLN